MVCMVSPQTQRQPAIGLGLCHNADETEMVSLREEQENHLIRDSVRLNFEKKTIDCTLPVQGDEQEFLSPNKDIATSAWPAIAGNMGVMKK